MRRYMDLFLDHALTWSFGGLILWAVLVIALDIIAEATRGVGSTISWQTQLFAAANLIAPYLVCLPLGLLTVHFFCTRNPAWNAAANPIWSALLGWGTGAAAGILFWRQRGP